MDLYEVMRTTGAVRRFTGAPLPDTVLARILDNARFAPSGGNRQGVRVIAVRDAGTRSQIGDLCSTGARRYLAQQSRGESPFNPLRPTAVTPETLAATDVPGELTAPLRDCSVLLVVCVDLGVVAAMDQDLDRIGLVAGASVYPFVWNVLLAARSEGFGGVLTTMAIAEEPAVKALLGIPEDYAVAALVPLGEPQQQPRRLTRKPVTEFTTRESFDGGPL